MLTQATSQINHSALVWLRRDLRLDDHAALSAALRNHSQVYLVFIFDRDILQPLPRADRRVEFIHGALLELQQQIKRLAPHAGLIVRHDHAPSAISELVQRFKINAVYVNHDDEPQSLARDAHIKAELAQQNTAFHSFKDHVIFERSEVLSQSATPYTVFTPYKNAWLRQLANGNPLAAHATESLAQRLAPLPANEVLPSLSQIGFAPTNLSTLPIQLGSRGARATLDDFLTRISDYQRLRDYPARKGVSYLSVHLRFGTISIRELARHAYPQMLSGDAGATIWLNELCWRDFYAQLLHHFPHVCQRAFKPAYDAIQWTPAPLAQTYFDAWCQGRTGYPLVDAAMRQLNHSGYMHNRLRMVAASFLIKDLGIDWRWGEAYFAHTLLDFDLSANNGGWQWAASSGCDAQPYFRIFHPVTQSQKFDPQGQFIRRYCPELSGLSDRDIHAPWQASALELSAAGLHLTPAGSITTESSANEPSASEPKEVQQMRYPLPLIDHRLAREQTLARYAVVKRTAPEAIN